MRRPIVWTAFLIASACGGTPEAPGPVDARLVLAPGQVAVIEGRSTRIRFDGVAADSRCPADALCVRAGDALVEITVLEGGQSAAYDLHTEHATPVTHRDLTIALEQLLPYPYSSQPIRPEDYRATIRVTR